MPYRAELKRPDLKGSFPCSVCGKIFCHSSSLSRHRMQAHFKSYTCTQCNQEISSNDTLRSHMFRFHNITRMFMCRCCNWAFPDKTSLHIHMQSMLRNGTPGDVAVLARSSTEADAISVGSPSHSPSFSAESLLKNQMTHLQNNNNNATLSNNNINSIFPNLLKSQETIAKQMFPLDLSSMGPNQFLTAWLASNQLNSNSLNTLSLNKTKKEQSDQQPASTPTQDEMLSEYDELEVRTTEEDLKEEITSTDVSPRSVIVKIEPNEKKRKMSFDDNDDIDVEGDETEPPLKMTIIEKHLHISNDQPSPTVSDSHISGSSSQSGESSKCFDCQVAKAKLTSSEEKCRNYEKHIRDLQFQLDIIRKIPPTPTPANIPRPPMIPQMMMPPMMTIPTPNPQNNLLQNPAMRLLFNNFMQNQLNLRPMC